MDRSSPRDGRPPAGDEAQLSVWLLGGFRAAVGGRPIDHSAWRLRRAAGLIKMLALAPGHRLHREQVIEALWPGVDLASAGNSLHQVLYFARRALRSDPSRRRPGIYPRLEGEALALGAPGSVWTDVAAFEHAAAEARKMRAPWRYREALDIYDGDLLPDDLYEDWATARRDALRQTHRILLMELAALHEEQGNLREAHAVLEEVIGIDPAYEPAHAALMRSYALAGQRDQALQQYRRLRDVLRREVDAEPDEASQRLHADIREGRFPGPSRAPHTVPELDTAPRRTRPRRSRTRAPLSGRSRPGNLPEPLTSFVGREHEVSGVRQALAHARLVTLLGPAGIGKTRLALRVAAEVAPSYPDGAWFADLTAVSEATQVPDVVAAALGVQTAPRAPVLDALARHLRQRRLLLVLDNCEHVASSCADLAVSLLAGSPGLRILATSRAVLNVHGESKWHVPPLALPEPDAILPPRALERCDAVRLFVERAQLSRPGFRLAHGGAAIIADLCRRLDGLPLAIELAAARVGTLAPRQIAERLREGLDALASGGRGTPDRQQTLRSAAAWSYRLLDDVERAVFDRCAVFAGSFTVEAAAAVCRDTGVETSGIDVLARLVDKSMVTIEETEGGLVRYRLLETMRAFGQERLDAGGAAARVRAAHAAFYLALVEAGETASETGDQGPWLDRIEADYENIRAAIRWAVDRQDGAFAARFVHGLYAFWRDSGHAPEGRRLAVMILALPGMDAPTQQRADLLAMAGGLAWLEGVYGEAQEHLEAGLTLARRVGAQATEASVLNMLGLVARAREDTTTARRYYEESLAIYRHLGNHAREAAVLNNLAFLAMHQGDLDAAQALLEEKRAIDRRLGNKIGLAFALNGLAMVAVKRGDSAAAERLFEESLGLRRQIGDRVGVARTLAELAGTIASRGDLVTASAQLEESLALWRDLRLPSGLVLTLGSLGAVALHQQEIAGARACFDEQVRVAHGIGDRPHLVNGLEGLARVAVAETAYARALRLAAAASALSAGQPSAECMPAHGKHGPTVETARSALDAREADACWADGLHMDEEQAVAYALGGGLMSQVLSEGRPQMAGPARTAGRRAPDRSRPPRDQTD